MKLIPAHLLSPKTMQLATELCIVNDVEQASHLPGNPLLRLPDLLPLAGRLVVLESLFPEVRTLAYLSAQGQSPQRGDWLAARVMVFSLHHLALNLAELALMDSIQLKLQTLAAQLSLPVPQLQSFAALRTPCVMQTCGAGGIWQIADGNVVQQSLQLREQLQHNLQPLRSALQRIPINR